MGTSTVIKIINQAQKFIDRVCGITNEKGIIIVCTDQSLQSGEDLNARELAESEASFKVCKQYSYMKIDTNDGNLVCFVEGDDAVAFSYLNLLVAWLRSELTDYDLCNNQDTLIKNVLLENEFPGDIPLKAKEFRINFVARRIAMVLYSETQNLLDLVTILKEQLNPRQDFIVLMDDHNLIIIKEVRKDVPVDFDSLSKEILQGIDLKLYPDLCLGIGMPVENLRDCSKSYREASLALTVGDIFEENTPVRRYDKLGLSRLIYQLPATLCQMFLDEVFPKNTYESLGDETLQTIDLFFENNLNGSETSRQLFVHRNTLVYRLDKVQKITGLDLRSFDDAVMFKLAAMVRKYLLTLSNSPKHFMNPNTRL